MKQKQKYVWVVEISDEDEKYNRTWNLEGIFETEEKARKYVKEFCEEREYEQEENDSNGWESWNCFCEGDDYKINHFLIQ